MRECLPSFPAVSGSAAFLFVQAAVRTAGPGLVISPLSSSQYRHSKREIQKCINSAIQFLIYSIIVCANTIFSSWGGGPFFLPEIRSVDPDPDPDPQSFYLLDPDPDPHSEKLLDPDPQTMNADPQPCLKYVHKDTNCFSSLLINN